MGLDQTLALLGKYGLTGRVTRIESDDGVVELAPERPAAPKAETEQLSPEHARELLEREWYHSSEGGPS
jgi:hypothetical protein